jgi:hypothetical protein
MHSISAFSGWRPGAAPEAKATRLRSPPNKTAWPPDPPRLYCAALRGTARGWRMSLRFFTASNTAG